MNGLHHSDSEEEGGDGIGQVQENSSLTSSSDHGRGVEAQMVSYPQFGALVLAPLELGFLIDLGPVDPLALPLLTILGGNADLEEEEIDFEALFQGVVFDQNVVFEQLPDQTYTHVGIQIQIQADVNQAQQVNRIRIFGQPLLPQITQAGQIVNLAGPKHGSHFERYTDPMDPISSAANALIPQHLNLQFEESVYQPIHAPFGLVLRLGRHAVLKNMFVKLLGQEGNVIDFLFHLGNFPLENPDLDHFEFAGEFHLDCAAINPIQIPPEFEDQVVTHILITCQELVPIARLSVAGCFVPGDYVAPEPVQTAVRANRPRTKSTTVLHRLHACHTKLDKINGLLGSMPLDEQSTAECRHQRNRVIDEIKCIEREIEEYLRLNPHYVH